MPDFPDITKSSVVLARERKTGKAVCLYAGPDIQAALNVAEKIDAAKYDQMVIWRKPQAYKRRQFDYPAELKAREEKAEAEANAKSEAKAKAEADAKAKAEAAAAAKAKESEGPAQPAPAA